MFALSHFNISNDILTKDNRSHSHAVKNISRSDHSSHFTSDQFEFGKIAIYPKLNVNQLQDEQEREADYAADQVAQASSSNYIAKEQTPDSSHSFHDIKKAEIVNAGIRPSSNTSGLEVNGHIADEMNKVRSSGGFQLDANTRQLMEARFGHETCIYARG